MATTSHRSTSTGGEFLVFLALIVLLVGLLVFVAGLFVGLSPSAIWAGSASVPAYALAAAVIGFAGGAYLAVVGTLLVLAH